MEFADSGDLFQRITDKQKNGTWFEENEIWHIFIQTVRGLRVLHDLKILHRDMKVC
jgi:serine/threonine protein kinase